MESLCMGVRRRERIWRGRIWREMKWNREREKEGERETHPKRAHGEQQLESLVPPEADAVVPLENEEELQDAEDEGHEGGEEVDVAPRRVEQVVLVEDQGAVGEHCAGQREQAQVEVAEVQALEGVE